MRSEYQPKSIGGGALPIDRLTTDHTRSNTNFGNFLYIYKLLHTINKDIFFPITQTISHSSTLQHFLSLLLPPFFIQFIKLFFFFWCYSFRFFYLHNCSKKPTWCQKKKIIVCFREKKAVKKVFFFLNSTEKTRNNN